MADTELWNRWIKGGISGKLLGTFSLVDMFGKPGPIGEVYWINDPQNVGLRYPDNSRMVVSTGWLAWRDKELVDNFKVCVREYNKAHGIIPPLRIQEPEKKKLRIKGESKPEIKEQKLGTKSPAVSDSPPKLRIGLKKLDIRLK